jgi:two-component system chemotaxis response regulator CheY
MALGRILVVDDEPYIRQTVRLLLTRAGYEVVEAGDGEEAIKVLDADDNASKIDAILCDLQMPNVDGAQALAYFRTHYLSVPLVILTGAPDFVLTDVLMKQGATDYLLKPVSDKRLLQVIREAVRLHELRKKQDSA